METCKNILNVASTSPDKFCKRLMEEGVVDGIISLKHLEEAVKILLKNPDGIAHLKYNAIFTSLTTFSSGVGLFLLPPPFGLITGAALGGLTSYLITKDKFKSIPEIMGEMSQEQCDLLRVALVKAVEEFNFLSAIKTVQLLRNPKLVKQIVPFVLKTFIRLLSSSSSSTRLNSEKTDTNNLPAGNYGHRHTISRVSDEELSLPITYWKHGRIVQDLSTCTENVGVDKCSGIDQPLRRTQDRLDHN